ncbi:MAG TPA: hypothetical protein VFN56_04965 [Candidatus Saccharimonadales bacterium]|nr:hypothetical protein [Candidatus Saccharimonadales bacterium]
MALEYEDGIVTMYPGPVDVHAHPRVFDPQTSHDISGQDGYEGKAGLPIYSEVALRSGIVLIGAMPNESYREIVPNAHDGEATRLIQFPISNYERARIMGHSIRTQSRINATYYLGVDPTEIFDDSVEQIDAQTILRNFALGGKDAKALKLFGNISTGGNNVPIQHFPQIVGMWHSLYPRKPIIMHLEDENVGTVLDDLYAQNYGRVPVHVAHVSSREELSSVIVAKERGQNVTCEVTPHHLFTLKNDGALIGGYGCMKPTLKSLEDVNFLWDNLSYIDIFASDCAPHKNSEKEASPPTFGVTNHSTWIPLLFGAVEAGKLSLEQMEACLVTNPRRIFNLPENDSSLAAFDLTVRFASAKEVEQFVAPNYQSNIFQHLERTGQMFRMIGRLIYASSGQSVVIYDQNMNTLIPDYKTSLTHLV